MGGSRGSRDDTVVGERSLFSALVCGVLRVFQSRVGGRERNAGKTANCRCEVVI